MQTCYIFSAADGLPEKLEIKKGDLVIAADLGFENAGKLGVKPDIVLGDFDSLGYEPSGIEIIKHPVRKDDTDTLLAIKVGLGKGYKKFVIYGGTGGRLDHTIANIQSLAFLAENNAFGILKGDKYCVTAIKNRSVSFCEKARGNVSVFAFEKVSGVSISGLLYELENAELSPCFPLGVSNEFIGKKSEISVKNGTLIIYYDGNEETASIN